jgi:hypothetical protein
MKALFFLIVIANLSLFMWEYRQGAFEPALQIPYANAESMLLVSEVETLPQDNKSDKELPINSSDSLIEPVIADNSPTTQEPAAIEPSMPASEASSQITTLVVDCYEAGPFPDTKAYEKWRGLLADTKESIKSFDRDEQIISSYMTFYPAQKNLEQTNNALKMLKDQGIKDYLLQRAGKDQGEISLGVFNTEDRALILKNQLKAKGIAAEIRPRYKSKMRTYVQVTGSGVVLESLQKLQNENPEFTVTPLTTCP